MALKFYFRRSVLDTARKDGICFENFYGDNTMFCFVKSFRLGISLVDLLDLPERAWRAETYGVRHLYIEDLYVATAKYRETIGSLRPIR